MGDARGTVAPPGSSLALASGILCLLSWWLPPVAGLLGLFGWFQVWRIRRALRQHPEIYSGNGIAVAAGVLLWLGSLGAFLLIVLAVASHGPPPADALRW